MTVQGETRQVAANITRLVWADGKDQTPQWEVQLRWPWTPASNPGGDKTWVTQADFPAWTAATKGAVNLEVAAGYVKKDRDKNPYDGSREWMWHWYIKRVLDHAPTPPQPVPGVPPAPDRGSIDQRIAWNSAVNNANHTMARQWKELEMSEAGLTEYARQVKELASYLYPVITSSPPAADAQDGATLPAEAPTAGEPPRTPAPALCGFNADSRPPGCQLQKGHPLSHDYRQQTPVGQARKPAPNTTPGLPGVIASLNQWNADIRGGAREGKQLSRQFVEHWCVEQHYLAEGEGWEKLTVDAAIDVAAAIANGVVEVRAA